MPFQKGQSGNPAGRPRGSRNRAAIALQELLERDAESIARTVIHLAKHGNIAAIRMCMGAAAAAPQARAGHSRSPCARHGRGRGRGDQRHRGRGRERRSHGIGGGRSRQGGRPPRAGAGERRLRGAPGQAGERSGAGGRWRRMVASAGTRREPCPPHGPRACPGRGLSCVGGGGTASARQ